MTMSALPIVVKSEKLFLSNFHRRRYPAKSTIIYAGDKADVLYYLVKGTVSVLVEDGNDEKDMIVTYLNPGEFLEKWGFLKSTLVVLGLKLKLTVKSVKLVTQSSRRFIKKNLKSYFRSLSRLLRDLGKRPKKQVIWRF